MPADWYHGRQPVFDEGRARLVRSRRYFGFAGRIKCFGLSRSVQRDKLLDIALAQVQLVAITPSQQNLFFPIGLLKTHRSAPRKPPQVKICRKHAFSIENFLFEVINDNQWAFDE